MKADNKRAVILVVDDEPEIREFMKSCLEIEGFEVITAANGMDGLARYKEHQHQVRIVVTDLDMPRMSGSDMVRHIFQITPAMKVIVASGRSHSDTQGASRLQKPYSRRELSHAVRRLL